MSVNILMELLTSPLMQASLEKQHIIMNLQKKINSNHVIIITYYRFSVPGKGEVTHYNPCQAFHMNRCWNTHVSSHDDTATVNTFTSQSSLHAGRSLEASNVARDNQYNFIMQLHFVALDNLFPCLRLLCTLCRCV